MYREWIFIVECCRYASRGTSSAKLRELAAAALDWPLVERIGARHRVEGIAHKALRDAGVRSPFASKATGIARQNLFHVAEAKRLHDRLDASGIAHLFFKGATLDMLAWKSLALKKSIDVDILVDPERYGDACTILRECDYRCVPPYPGDLPVGQIYAYAKTAKDSLWRNSDLGVTVELHLRLTQNPALLPMISVRSPSQLVHLGSGIALPTLARDELFAYLCVHGALTAWSRLKWLADLSAFLSPGDDLDTLYRRALTLAPGRAVPQALLVCEALFGLSLGALKVELRRDPITRWLARVALDTMVKGGPDKELSDQRLGTAGIHFSILFLQRGFGYKVADLARQFRRVARRLQARAFAILR